MEIWMEPWEFFAVMLAYFGGASINRNDSIWVGWTSFLLLLVAFTVIRLE